MTESQGARKLSGSEAAEEPVIRVQPRPGVSKALIVGLGNPGRKHKENRHNIGFMVADALASTHGISLSRIANRAIMGSGRVGETRVILAKPQTYMNLSGDSVGPLANYYQIPSQQVLVIYDELDLPFGTVRLREQGGAGGHNGMKSIISHIGREFPRIRLGIGRPSGQMPPAAYVLRDFDVEEREIVAEMVQRAVLTVETFLSEGLDLAMSRHNGPLPEIS